MIIFWTMPVTNRNSSVLWNTIKNRRFGIIVTIAIIIMKFTIVTFGIIMFLST